MPGRLPPENQHVQAEAAGAGRPVAHRAPGASTPPSDAAPPSPIPAITLPKGGGAIRGIGEKFEVQPSRGTASFSVPLPLPAGRNGMTPPLALRYDSGSGQSPFGLGWSLGAPGITRKTDRGLPRYDDEEDVFIWSGAEDLVPALELRDGAWQRMVRPESRDGAPCLIHRYRPRVEVAYACIERITRSSDGVTWWEVRTRDNVLHVYGKHADARVVDLPDAPPERQRVFQWVLQESADDRGNRVEYSYRREDLRGVELTAPEEASRLDGRAPPTQLYLKQVRWGNVPEASGSSTGFAYHLILDYGDHPGDVPAYAPTSRWPARPDPFSTTRAGFEIRTWRLCQRVLLFHDFAELGPAPTLTRGVVLEHALDAAATTVVGIRSMAWRGAIADSLPTLRLGYTRAAPSATVEEIDAESLVNLPVGADDEVWRWADLDGEGLSGLLTRQAGSWFYKRNLGQGRFGALERLPSQPSLSAAGTEPALSPITADGRMALLVRDPGLHGFHRRTDDGTWAPFEAIRKDPGVPWQSPDLHSVDLDGDGLPDLLFHEGGSIRWHRSLGAEGWDAPERVRWSNDEARGPQLIVGDATLAVFTADMNGDGLAEIVHVRNGSVCYWPNLGYGRFGPRVQMANAPVFEDPDHFDPRRLRLADLDGTGPIDLVYLGHEGVRLWHNQSGNRWSAAERLHNFPLPHDLAAVSVVDLLGTGTACLVWSSPLPGESARRFRYVDLSQERAADGAVPEAPVAGHKPWLLDRVDNQLGAVTRTTYAPSTRYYLEDRAAGRPWLTRLPFPVQVVARVERRDEVRDTRFVNTWRYRHGYYDGQEREFRGFALVEQVDTDSVASAMGRRQGADGVGPGRLAANESAEHWLPAVVTRSWFHTGAFLEAGTLEALLRREHYQGDPQGVHLEDTVYQGNFSLHELREAARALAGQALRVEVFAKEAPEHPYTVTATNHAVRRVQPQAAHPHAVVEVLPHVSVTQHYDQNPMDPRVALALTLDVDDWGNPTRTASVVCGRRPGPAQEPEQTRPVVIVTESRVVNPSGSAAPWRVGVPVETWTWELGGPLPAAVPVDPTTLRARFLAATAVAYEVDAVAGTRRLIDHTRVYYADDRDAAALAAGTRLPLGEIGLRALVHSTLQRALTDGLISLAWPELVATPAARAELEATLRVDGGYLREDGQWYAWAGQVRYDPARYFQVITAVDPWAKTLHAELDASALFVTGTTDALQNRTRATMDYRVLAPRLLEDPNGARSEVNVDVLGRVVSLTERGHSGEGGVSARFAYDLSRTGGRPALARAWLRRSYAAEIWDQGVVYSDGTGQPVLTKAEAEPEELDGPTRWVGTGRTVLDNKGNPVKQYEPYFATDDGYDTEASLVQSGVTPILRYDPVGRLVRTDHPDGSYERIERNPWSEAHWDANDTSGAADHQWAQTRLNHTDPDERAPALAARTHQGTPEQKLLDSLGRPFLTLQDNGSFTRAGEARPYRTRQALDVEGNVLQVMDPREESRPLLTQTFDALGRVVRQVSVDSGTRWSVPDVAGKPILTGDGRGYRVQFSYDELGRPLTRRVTEPGVGQPQIRERIWYGEELGPSAAQSYHRGRVWRTGDGAGRLDIVAYDFMGQPADSARRLWRGSELPRWPDAQESGIEGALTTRILYDAQGRPVEVRTPDGGVERRAYTPRGALASIERDGRSYLSQVVYDAKGQRTSVRHGDGLQTIFSYDSLTFRLVRLRSTHTAGRVLQDIQYTYDAVGNILRRADGSQPEIYFRNQFVPPACAYTYDSLYRLIRATGREFATSETGYGPDESGRFTQGIPQPADARALRPYEQRYIYDEIGNFEEMRHLAGGETRWVREYDYVPGTNRLLRTRLRAADVNGEVAEECPPDENGNMRMLAGITRMEWDDQDRLLKTEKQGQEARYRYDAGGERAIKVRVAAQVTEERVYLGSVERWRRFGAGGVLTDERWTWHGMDGYTRFVMVENERKKDGRDVNETRARYQLGDHLGSSHVEVSESGAVISYEEYHPYGTTAFQLFNPASGVSAKRYRYTGKERDEETGLNYHSARYYAPWLGRWCSCDPDDNFHTYTYCNDRPGGSIDHDGAAPESVESLLSGAQAFYQAHYVKISHYADYFDTTAHAQQGKARWVDRIAGMVKGNARLTESEHLLPGAAMKVMNPAWVYNKATTIVLPRAIALMKTHSPTGDNALSKLVRQGVLSGEEAVSRFSANALRAAASHWAQTGETSLAEVSVVSKAIEIAKAESGVVDKAASAVEQATSPMAPLTAAEAVAVKNVAQTGLKTTLRSGGGILLKGVRGFGVALDINQVRKDAMIMANSSKSTEDRVDAGCDIAMVALTHAAPAPIGAPVRIAYEAVKASGDGSYSGAAASSGANIQNDLRRLGVSDSIAHSIGAAATVGLAMAPGALAGDKLLRWITR